MVLPDMLKNAPMFKNIKKSNIGIGRGKAAILRAQGERALPLLSLSPPLSLRQHTFAQPVPLTHTMSLFLVSAPVSASLCCSGIQGWGTRRRQRRPWPWPGGELNKAPARPAEAGPRTRIVA